ncbi:hypothetical protein NI17_012110 [Thermobifida halotolerans]|uniref:Uncharacterized protein n=1 Tax=Thermobifida halotolerans TaxID=483545 RepID=A0AA97M1D2_9ACTN|nr:hypothetical protein NI17_012110 [Thermobifida halotolerans]
MRRSLHRFRQITGLRIGLAMTPVVMGAAASIAGGGLFPYTVAFLLAWPQLLLAFPGYFTVSRARRAMEAWGTKAYLWAALAQPARVEWPLITRLLDRRRARLSGERSPKAAKSFGESLWKRRRKREKQEEAAGEEAPALPGVPDRLTPPSTPMTPVEAVVPGFADSPKGTRSGSATGPALRLPVQLQLLRLRANTRPRPRSRRVEQRHRAKNNQGN